jgi:hypothetical protein
VSVHEMVVLCECAGDGALVLSVQEMVVLCECAGDGGLV